MLAMCLYHLIEFLPDNVTNIVVVDDNTDDHYHRSMNKFCTEVAYAPEIEYVYNEQRLGIAKSKNECLKRLKHCDYIFLFDDDCFPQKDGWAELYIDAYKRTNCHHFIHNQDCGVIAKTSTQEGVETYLNCAGVLLFLTRHVIDNVGGFDKRFGIYGYEHAQYSSRIQRSGLMGKFGPYATPEGSADYIYSADIAFTLYQDERNQPPLSRIEDFKSSLPDSEKNASIPHNTNVMNQYAMVYQPL
jgi:GT2 family glycosyltransferase